MKDLLLSILLTKTSIEKPILSKDLFDQIKPKLSLRSFQRELPNIVNDYNLKTYEKVIKGQIPKDKAILILSSKGIGFYAAKDRESRKQGAIRYFLTVKAELEKSRFIAKCIREIDDFQFQQDFEFLAEKESGSLF